MEGVSYFLKHFNCPGNAGTWFVRLTRQCRELQPRSLAVPHPRPVRLCLERLTRIIKLGVESAEFYFEGFDTGLDLTD